MYRSLLMACGVALLGVSSVFGQVRFEHKVKEETASVSEVVFRLEQKLAIAGMDTETKMNNQVKVAHKSGKRDANGQIQVDQKNESLQVSLSGTGFDYTFDSNNPDQEGNSPVEFLRKIHQAAMKQTTVLTYDKENKIVSVEIKDNVFQSLPVQVQDLVRSQLDPAALKKRAEQELGQLPSSEVKVGESWNRADSQDFGGGQSMTFDLKYTYEGPVEQNGRQLDRVSIKATGVTYDLEAGKLPLTLKGSALKVTESKGELLFDREAGKTVQSTMDLRIVGDIQFEANGTPLPSKLDLKLHTESNTK